MLGHNSSAAWGVLGPISGAPGPILGPRDRSGLGSAAAPPPREGRGWIVPPRGAGTRRIRIGIHCGSTEAGGFPWANCFPWHPGLLHQASAPGNPSDAGFVWPPGEARPASDTPQRFCCGFPVGLLPSGLAPQGGAICSSVWLPAGACGRVGRDRVSRTDTRGSPAGPGRCAPAHRRAPPGCSQRTPARPAPVPGRGSG